MVAERRGEGESVSRRSLPVRRWSQFSAVALRIVGGLSSSLTHRVPPGCTCWMMQPRLIHLGLMMSARAGRLSNARPSRRARGCLRVAYVVIYHNNLGEHAPPLQCLQPDSCSISFALDASTVNSTSVHVVCSPLPLPRRPAERLQRS